MKGCGGVTHINNVALRSKLLFGRDRIGPDLALLELFLIFTILSKVLRPSYMTVGHKTVFQGDRVGPAPNTWRKPYSY